ncbi:MAG: preprotein translocase subunit SecE [Candidatus Koribacter versatilis]|uniref:Protein translocase subunit SecE n=1 Tax=Candidatus Korobacter versatilis TaxID=658062 RepID=A0A932ABA7_9BACT|nr:preprotein translocase subunit SecE [Candidatus Koribacter versatilis]
MAKSAAQLMDENSVGGQIKSWPDRTRSFYTDVRTEMKKVSTPSLKEVQATTAVVLITVALFGVYFWLVDLGLAWGVQRLMDYFTK